MDDSAPDDRMYERIDIAMIVLTTSRCCYHILETIRDCMKDLIAFQRDILYIIAELENSYGLAIADEFADYYNTEIQHGRLYPNLDTLVDKGLV